MQQQSYLFAASKASPEHLLFNPIVLAAAEQFILSHVKTLIRMQNKIRRISLQIMYGRSWKILHERDDCYVIFTLYISCRYLMYENVITIQCYFMVKSCCKMNGSAIFSCTTIYSGLINKVNAKNNKQTIFTTTYVIVI